MGHSAERVLAGELPHRDFDEIYTGGLSYLHALAFRTLGTNLISLRVVLFIFFLAWVPALYYVASRFASPIPAGGAALLAVIWSLPNYFAAIPSWYNLFFAVFGIAALLRHLETGRRRWLVVAGACGGLSLLVKVAGLYYIAAALLFLAYREQCMSRATQEGMPERGQAYPLFVGTSLLLFVIGLFGLILPRAGAPELVQFVLPGATVAFLLLWNEKQEARGTSWERFANLGRLVTPFALGIAIPVSLFVIPYVIAGSLGDLVQGVFVTPFKRLSLAAMRPPGLLPSAFATLLLLLLLAAFHRKDQLRLVDVVLVVLVLGTGLFAAFDDSSIYRLVWHSIRTLVPVIALAGAFFLMYPRAGGRLPVLRRQQLMLVLSATVLVSLVQYPFSAPIYFCYVAPLVVLSALAILSTQEHVSQFGPAALLAFFLAFGVFLVNREFIYSLGLRFRPHNQTELLAFDRAVIRVAAWDKDQYGQLVRLLKQHSSGDFVYGTPDCPEVYFLSGLQNPTRTLFDFFDDPTNRATRILRTLEEHGVTAIALNRRPQFSGPVAPELQAALDARYPDSVQVGFFVVRWRP